jgi:hypothetical protein
VIKIVWWLIAYSMNDSKAFTFIAHAHPRIAAALKLYWGEPEFVPYVENLLNDTRNGERKGFQGDMVIALQNLLERHNLDYPRFSPSARMSLWHTNMKIR